ncbi:MAG: hypothetical protein AAF702_14310 [Chloroflexota bacterium]
MNESQTDDPQDQAWSEAEMSSHLNVNQLTQDIQLSPRWESQTQPEGSTTTEERRYILGECLRELRQNVHRMRVLSEVTNDVKEKYQVGDVVEATLNAVWNRSSLRFAVVILGRTELGPYYYAGMRGAPTPWLHLLHECPFPLSGALAETLLLRRSPHEPDYLYISDLQEPGRPTSDEFPWLPLTGSLLMVPLRGDDQVHGVLMLGDSRPGAFDSPNRCKDYEDIATIAAEAIQQAQMYQEITSNAEKLVNAQLITRELALVEDRNVLISTLIHKLPAVSGKIKVQLFLPDQNQTSDTQEIVLTTYPTYSSISDSPQFSTPHPVLTDGQENLASPIMDLIHWSLKSGQPLFYDVDTLEAQSDRPLYNDTSTAAIIPMADQHQIYGVLHIMLQSKQEHLDESEMVALRVIANSAAVVLAKLQAIEEKDKAIYRAMQSLVELVETRFPLLQGHSGRMAHNATLLAQKIGIDDPECLHIRVAASFHDVGMTQVTQNDFDVMPKANSASNQPQIVPHTTAETIRESCRLLESVGMNQSVTQYVADFANYKEQSITSASVIAHQSIKDRLIRDTSISKDEIKDGARVSTPASEISLEESRSNPFNQFHLDDQICSIRQTHSASSIPDTQNFSEATHIMALVDELDTFLMQTPSALPSIAGLALAFLQQSQNYPSHLVESLQSLIEQELVLLP